MLSVRAAPGKSSAIALEMKWENVYLNIIHCKFGDNFITDCTSVTA